MERRFTKEEWAKHVEAGEEHPGGIKCYCREQNLSNSTFHYWRHKLKAAKRQAPKATFARVEVVKAAPRKLLPDPSWLAAFLLAYSGGER